MQLFCDTASALHKQCSACSDFSSCLLLLCILLPCRIAPACPLVKKPVAVVLLYPRCRDNVAAQPARYACIQHLNALRIPNAMLKHSQRNQPQQHYHACQLQVVDSQRARFVCAHCSKLCDLTGLGDAVLCSLGPREEQAKRPALRVETWHTARRRRQRASTT